MWSFQDQYEFGQSQAQDQDATHLTQLKKFINMGNKKLEIEIGMPAAQEERTYSTLTSTNSYPLPERFISLDLLYSTVSSQRHYADNVYDESQWGAYMRRPNQVVSDVLDKVFTRPGLQRFEIFPIAATAGNTMTMIYNAFSKDMTAANYTTGTITTLANGGTAVTFSGATLTALMAGRWLKTDDGEWYKIQSVNTVAGTAVLLMPYQGTAIAAGTSSFVIGELPRTPEGTHEIAVYYALWQHFQGVKRDSDMAKDYKALWDEGKLWAKEQFGHRYASNVIPSQRRRAQQKLKNPVNYPNLSGA